MSAEDLKKEVADLAKANEEFGDTKMTGKLEGAGLGGISPWRP
jgi:hypothetical protein